MDLGALEVQIFVSLALVLGAVLVALVCDFLKGNNECLRERNIELTVRQDERERREKRRTGARTPTAPQPRRAQDNRASFGGDPRIAKSLVAPPASVPPTAVPQGSVPRPDTFAADAAKGSTPSPGAASRRDLASQHASWATKQEQEMVKEMAERIRKLAKPEPPRGKESGLAEKSGSETPAPDSPPTPETESESADQNAAPPSSATNSAEADSERPPLSIHAKVTPIDVVATERATTSEALRLTRELERVAEMTVSELEENTEQRSAETEVESAEPASSGPPLEADLLSDAAESSPADSALATLISPPPSEELPELTAAVNSDHEPERETPKPTFNLPRGFHPYSELARAIEANEPLRGAIVSIGVSLLDNNPSEHPATGAPADPLITVTEQIVSLLTPNDFGCRTDDDEFILVLPGEVGAPMQKRLQSISQHLWDYQIRSVGAQGIMFSWGAAETSGEPLNKALESAKEQMHQTKRNRARASSEIHHYRRRLAND